MHVELLKTRSEYHARLWRVILSELWVACFLPWNRIFTKSRGCRSRVDAAPPLTPATRCSHFKWRNIPLTGGVTLASFTCDLLMVRLSGVWLSLYMNILNSTWNVSKICKTYTTLKVKERRILLHFHTSLSYVYSITTRSHFDVTSQAIRVIFLCVMIRIYSSCSWEANIWHDYKCIA